jgi:hypothetical protein
MSCKAHAGHSHTHGPSCGHQAIQHGNHTDYLHDGHLHHVHEGHVDEHSLSVGDQNPDDCTPDHRCRSHGAAHEHGPECGHEAIPHGDHICYVVEGHLHYPHDGHCDHHGDVTFA